MVIFIRYSATASARQLLISNYYIFDCYPLLATQRIEIDILYLFTFNIDNYQLIIISIHFRKFFILKYNSLNQLTNNIKYRTLLKWELFRSTDKTKMNGHSVGGKHLTSSAYLTIHNAIFSVMKQSYSILASLLSFILLLNISILYIWWLLASLYHAWRMMMQYILFLHDATFRHSKRQGT